jgi:hypothetical protein
MPEVCVPKHPSSVELIEKAVYSDYSSLRKDYFSALAIELKSFIKRRVATWRMINYITVNLLDKDWVTIVNNYRKLLEGTTSSKHPLAISF